MKKWVVFKNGMVQAVCEHRHQAYNVMRQIVSSPPAHIFLRNSYDKTVGKFGLGERLYAEYIEI